MEAKNLFEISQMDESDARSYLESIRWPSGPACTHCGSVNVVRLQGSAHRVGLLKCRERGCRQQFTVTTGTIFHRSHIPLKKWVLAFHMMCSSKKGVSAKQLQRNLGLKSYQSAWHMCHRIRAAMGLEPLRSLLKGDVVADETYVGGKPRYGATTQRQRDQWGRIKRGRRPASDPNSKTPVVVVLERGGEARSMHVERVNSRTLRQAIEECVDIGASRLLTDENPLYVSIGKEFGRGHESVNHRSHEYLRGDVSTNEAESFFALLKRSVYGSWHHVSKKHLHRYVGETTFRWNHRKVDDGDRTVAALRGAEGRRLTYRSAVA